jgi:delta-aminolevulinic acid dehydratase/porphobilinogen synthase
MLAEVEEAMSYGVGSFVLFPKVEDSLKTNYGEEAYNPKGVVPVAIQLIKEKFPTAIGIFNYCHIYHLRIFVLLILSIHALQSYPP